jgi:hypothetical protein
MKHRTSLFLAALAAGFLALANCNRGDQVAPEGATIDLAATPSTIVTSDSPVCLALLSVSKCGTSDIVATVSSAVGVPMADQDVRFTNTAGLLFTGTTDNPQPAANIPIRTDDFGNAHVRLISGASSTVNARSGKALGSLSLQVTAANISLITLEQDTSGDDPECSTTPLEINNCDDHICLLATVLDDHGQGIPNLSIQFRLQNATGTNSFTGAFQPSQPVTDDPDGIARTTLTANLNDCSTKCTNFKCDGVQVVAFTTGGAESSPLTFTIAIQ